MVAQQLAADEELQAKYNISSTVTFGAPEITTRRMEGEIRRIAADFDPVTFANSPSLGAPLPFLGSTVMLLDSLVRQRLQQNIPSDFGLRGDVSHMKDYTNEANPELKKMDTLGRLLSEGRATLEFNPAQRVFFTSPVNSTGNIVAPPGGATGR
jgi:hypothetical protein